MEGKHYLRTPLGYCTLSDETTARLDADFPGWSDFQKMDKTTNEARKIQAEFDRMKEEIYKLWAKNDCTMFFEY